MLYRLVIPCLFSISLQQEQPNIIYIVSDDHDADAISAYKKKFIATPNIDRIGKEGMRSTNCYDGNFVRSPLSATVLGGQHSPLNGIKDNRTPLDGTLTPLPGLLKRGRLSNCAYRSMASSFTD
jgi:arylsulfatase A-like enzyme